MKCNLMKKKVNLEGGKTFYTFYLKFENGAELRVNPNSWTDKKNVKHDDYDKFLFVADDELPFSK